MIRRLSVIIPTRNRASSLKALLESLAAAISPPHAAVEVIVVNNGSVDKTCAVLREEISTSRRHELIVIEETRPGKSNAVNRALAAARGDIVMILDDDVAIHPECLTKHVEAHEQTQFAAIQGRIFPGKDPAGRPADVKRLREYNIPLIDYGDEITAIRGLTGTNMSFKREVLERVGSFDVRLGPGASGFSEDTEFSLRICNAGFRIGYTPHAIVYHELNPERYGRAYNRDVEFRKGLSRSIYRQDSILFKVFPDLVANCVRYCLYRLFCQSQKAYKTEGRLMKACGYLMGKWRRRMTADSRS